MEKENVKSEENVWHHLSAEEVAREWKTDLQEGLSKEEVQERRKQHGWNRMTSRRTTPAWKRFLHQFSQPLMYILILASLITAFLGEWVDAGVIFAVVFINGLVGFIQESKAEQAIEALAQMVKTEATARRGGRKMRVDAAELVPGDVVLLQSGDLVPADVRLCKVRSLRVDEAALTGESHPVEKNAQALEKETGLADRINLAFAGTSVTFGQAEGIVFATGDRTETGRIATMIHEAADLSTPLTKKIAQFSKLLLWGILVLAAGTFFLGLWRGETAFDMFMAGVALAVGAIPEGLPAAVTITLAIGVHRMARRRAIIRKLPAVETLGSTTVICSDKTGTLTENQMTVKEVWAGMETFHFGGTGYDPEGEIQADGQPVETEKKCALLECLKAGLLNNDSQLLQSDGRWEIQGDPTEAALIVAARKAGLLTEDMEKSHPRIDVIPFESEHQFMATLHSLEGGKMIYKKGALEKVLDRCTRQLDHDGREVPLDKEMIRTVSEKMASAGLRVLAFARKPGNPGQAELSHEHVQGDLIFLGIQGMIDPPRSEAIESVKICHEAGIQVKMITGDHLLTARAVARQLGLGPLREKEKTLKALSGRDLEKVSDEELPSVAESTHVFARVAPEQKLRLVRALQKKGHVVAMTGDGVNDAPALKQADIGIAMGITGTEVSKGAADMILTDDNFASIQAAVEEGRGVFDNLTKFIIWTLPTNAGEALILLTAIFFGMALPALPVQLLWINMTTAAFLGLMLVFEPKETDLMTRPPREPDSPILTYPLIMRTGLVTLLMLIGAYSLFVWEQKEANATLSEGRTIVMNVIVFVEAFYLVNCRSLLHSPWSIGFFKNKAVFLGIGFTILAQTVITYIPLFNRLFHTAPLSAESWGRILFIALVVFLVVELEKWIRLKAEAKVR